MKNTFRDLKGDIADILYFLKDDDNCSVGFGSGISICGAEGVGKSSFISRAAAHSKYIYDNNSGRFHKEFRFPGGTGTIGLYEREAGEIGGPNSIILFDPTKEDCLKSLKEDYLDKYLENYTNSIIFVVSTYADEPHKHKVSHKDITESLKHTGLKNLVYYSLDLCPTHTNNRNPAIILDNAEKSTLSSWSEYTKNKIKPPQPLQPNDSQVGSEIALQKISRLQFANTKKQIGNTAQRKQPSNGIEIPLDVMKYIFFFQCIAESKDLPSKMYKKFSPDFVNWQTKIAKQEAKQAKLAIKAAKQEEPQKKANKPQDSWTREESQRDKSKKR